MVLLAICTFLSLFAGCEDESTKTVNSLLRKMRAELPPGWTASFDPKYSYVSIQRNQPTMGDWEMVSPDPSQKPELNKFGFSLRVLAIVSPLEYRRLREENARIYQELQQIEGKLEVLGVQRSKGTYDSAKTTEGRAELKRYEQVKNTLHDLPQFSFEDLSLRWIFGEPDGLGFFPTDPAILDECHRTRQRVIDLLTPYETAPLRER